jgi:hypothetical protein
LTPVRCQISCGVAMRRTRHMATVLNNDDAIWLKHVKADANALALLRQVPAGTALRLEIEGVAGDWVRMADGRDGRPTLGLKPVGKTLTFWKSMKSRRGEYLEFKIVNPRDSYLADVQKTLSEWESDEDEAAFRDL